MLKRRLCENKTESSQHVGTLTARLHSGKKKLRIPIDLQWTALPIFLQLKKRKTPKNGIPEVVPVRERGERGKHTF
jgi:hypothetical protein